MYVILVGNPTEGFTVVGPLGRADRGGIGEWVRCKYGGSDWYECKLCAPPNEVGVSIDEAGTYVVFNGDLETPFKFFGPFTDYDAAVDYVERFAGGWAVMLHPIDREDIEVAA
jgi:hypothetical protein